jgi:hypothetical protein
MSPARHHQGRSSHLETFVFLHSLVENDRDVLKDILRREATRGAQSFDDAVSLVRTLDHHSNVSFTHVPLRSH